MEKICLFCGNGVIKGRATKYCSHDCYSKSNLGRKQTKKHRQRISKALKGKSKSPEHILKVAEAIRKRKWIAPIGENSPKWKGQNIGYYQVHDWLRAMYGNPSDCEFCGTKGIKYKNGRWTIEWSNISGTYRRERADFRGLCRKCHSDYDNNNPKIVKWLKRKYGYKPILIRV